MFTLDQVVPWGRSFDEYRCMFALTEEDLDRTMIGCGDGPASFNAEATRRGGRIVSCDPIYRFEESQIQERIADFSETMLARLRTRFAADPTVTIVAHDLNDALPVSLGTFDAVISSFAIHHVTHERKRTLYEEAHRLLNPGGVFCNLEHVASATTSLHEQFLSALSVDPKGEDPSNKLLDVETQLTWLRSIGFIDVDCHWKWRELALLAGVRSSAGGHADTV